MRTVSFVIIVLARIPPARLAASAGAETPCAGQRRHSLVRGPDRLSSPDVRE